MSQRPQHLVSDVRAFIGRQCRGPFPLRRQDYRRFGDREDRARRRTARAWSVLAVGTGLAYLLWLASAANWSHPFVVTAFLVAETCCLLLFALAAVASWSRRFKPMEAPFTAAPHPLDVLITVCGEPVHIVARTVAAASRISWHGPRRVYVLDDTGSADVDAVAQQYGAIYRSRPREGHPCSDAKAGNLNFGLSVSSGDYILTLDADQVPVPAIAERLAAYLAFPRVAFVQSKQSFLVPSDDPFYAEDQVFYNTLQNAFDAHDAVLSCGSGVLYRREALADIGGFATWNLVEDLTTSYELHSRGWKSLYYPHVLAVGLAPDTLAGVYKQRGQWALDTMRLLFWRCPLFRRTLSWPTRLNYVTIGCSYLTAGFVAPLFYAIPLWSYSTGEGLLTSSPIQFALSRILYFLTMTMALQWMFRGHQPGKQFQMLVGLFPVYCVNTLRAVRYRRQKPAYHVNNARQGRSDTPTVVMLAPQLTLLLLNAIGPFYALVSGSVSFEIIAANIPVSALAIWSLSHVCVAAFDRHRWEPERHPITFYACSES